MNLTIKKHLISNLPFKIHTMSYSSLNMTFFQKKKKKSFLNCYQTSNFSSFTLQDQKKIQMFQQLINTELERHQLLDDFNVLGYSPSEEDFQFSESIMQSHLFSYGFLDLLKTGFSTSGKEPKSFEFLDFLDIYKSYFMYKHYSTCNLSEVLKERPILSMLLLDSLDEITLINLSLKQGTNPLNIFDILVKNITLDSSEYVTFMYYPEIFGLVNSTFNPISDVMQESIPKIDDSSSLENLTLSFFLTKDFLLSSFSLLLIMILGGAVFLRDRLMKLLILLEILFLIIIIGFTLQQELVYMTSEPINMGILFIALAACEAVLGLSIIIIRTRVLTTYLTTHTLSFIKYTKNKLKIFQ